MVSRRTCLRELPSFFCESRACVKGESGMSKCFGVEVGMRQGFFCLLYVREWSCLRDKHKGTEKRSRDDWTNGKCMEGKSTIVCR